jgi:hypothetical protein
MTEQARPGIHEAAGAADAALMQELTALLDVEPSATFAPRVRARVHADRESYRAWWLRPAMAAAVACAAGVVLAVALSFERPDDGLWPSTRVVPQREGEVTTSIARVPAARAPADADGTAGHLDTPSTVSAGGPVSPDVSPVLATPRAPGRARPGAVRATQRDSDTRAVAVTPDDAGFRLLLRRLSDGTLSGPERLPASITESAAVPEVALEAAPLTVPPLDIAPLVMASAGDSE